MAPAGRSAPAARGAGRPAVVVRYCQAAEKLAGKRAGGLGSEYSRLKRSGGVLGPRACGAGAVLAGRAGARAAAADLPLQG